MGKKLDRLSSLIRNSPFSLEIIKKFSSQGDLFIVRMHVYYDWIENSYVCTSRIILVKHGLIMRPRDYKYLTEESSRF